MERETDKHSARVDEAMSEDVDPLLHGVPVESRAQEARVQEDPDVGPGRRFDLEDDASGSLGISDSDATRRAELARHLAGVDFPARRPALVRAARSDYAPDWVLDALEGLPDDREYANVQAVWQGIGGEVEEHHTN